MPQKLIYLFYFFIHCFNCFYSFTFYMNVDDRNIGKKFNETIKEVNDKTYLMF